MKNKIIILLILIILLNNVSATKISLSPAHIYISGKINTNLCKKFVLSSDKDLILKGEDRWSFKDERSNFAKYNLSSSELSLKLSYPKEITSAIKENYFCINSEKSGTFYGILYYKAVESPAGIGSLIKADISEENKQIPLFLTLISCLSLVLLLSLFSLLLWKSKVK